MKIPEWLKKAVAKFYLRYQRGNNLANFLRDMFIIIAGGIIIFEYINKNYNFYITPIWIWLLLSAVGVIIILYFIGCLDEKYGFWKVEARYSTEIINPYFKEMMDKIDRIEKKLK